LYVELEKGRNGPEQFVAGGADSMADVNVCGSKEEKKSKSKKRKRKAIEAKENDLSDDAQRGPIFNDEKRKPKKAKKGESTKEVKEKHEGTSTSAPKRDKKSKKSKKEKKRKGNRGEAPSFYKAADTHTHPPASLSDAALAMGQRKRCLGELQQGSMTADGIDEQVGWRIPSAGRRLSELHGARFYVRSVCEEGRCFSIWIASMWA
jgi:hypothetical protein